MSQLKFTGSFLCVMIVSQIFSSFVIALSFISVIPIPQKIIPLWNSHTLRCFCVMLPVVGVLFSLLWSAIWHVLTLPQNLSPILRGFFMMFCTLALTGGLHLDGLMDTCDAIFSRRDRQTRLQILSDTHAGSFAVMGCVLVVLAKSLLFSELLSLTTNHYTLITIPVYSRLGMAVLLNTLPFAKTGGLAVMLGGSRRKRDNLFFAAMMLLLLPFTPKTLTLSFVLCFLAWRKICLRIFGGITGDLLGAFVEVSEVIMLVGMVISQCM